MRQLRFANGGAYPPGHDWQRRGGDAGSPGPGPGPGGSPGGSPTRTQPYGGDGGGGGESYSSQVAQLVGAALGLGGGGAAAGAPGLESGLGSPGNVVSHVGAAPPHPGAVLLGGSYHGQAALMPHLAPAPAVHAHAQAATLHLGPGGYHSPAMLAHAAHSHGESEQPRVAPPHPTPPPAARAWSSSPQQVPGVATTSPQVVWRGGHGMPGAPNGGMVAGSARAELKWPAARAASTHVPAAAAGAWHHSDGHGGANAWDAQPQHAWDGGGRGQHPSPAAHMSVGHTSSPGHAPRRSPPLTLPRAFYHAPPQPLDPSPAPAPQLAASPSLSRGGAGSRGANGGYGMGGGGGDHDGRVGSGGMQLMSAPAARLQSPAPQRKRDIYDPEGRGVVGETVRPVWRFGGARIGVWGEGVGGGGGGGGGGFKSRGDDEKSRKLVRGRMQFHVAAAKSSATAARRGASSMLAAAVHGAKKTNVVVAVPHRGTYSRSPVSRASRTTGETHFEEDPADDAADA